MDLAAEVHKARIARLRHQRELRGEVQRQLDTLEAIRRERETQRTLDDEMESVRRRLGGEGSLSSCCPPPRGRPALFARPTPTRFVSRPSHNS